MPTGESLTEILGPILFQPPEAPATDAELSFIDDSPHDLWPNNQNSNFGLKRKVFTDKIQLGAEQLNAIFAHRFVATSDEFLDEWEEMTGLPVGVGTVGLRRAKVLARLNVGPFTHELLESLIEEFLVVTTGNPVQFTPEGVPITGAGIPLYGEPTSNVKSLYRIYFDYNAYTYYIYIKNTNNPDLVALTRELDRITPAGWQFVLDNTKTGPLHYGRMIVGDAPIMQLRLNGAGTDGSPYSNNGTLFGSPATIASPGLLHANAILAGSANSAYDFDGTDDYITVADSASLDTIGDVWTFSIVLRPDAIGANMTVFEKGASFPAMRINTTGQVEMRRGSSDLIAHSSMPLVAGTTYTVVLRKRGEDVSIKIDDVETAVPDANFVTGPDNGVLYIGRAAGGGQFYNGGIDEPSIFNRWLSDERATAHHQTRIGVA